MGKVVESCCQSEQGKAIVWLYIRRLQMFICSLLLHAAKGIFFCLASEGLLSPERMEAFTQGLKASYKAEMFSFKDPYDCYISILSWRDGLSRGQNPCGPKCREDANLLVQLLIAFWSCPFGSFARQGFCAAPLTIIRAGKANHKKHIEAELESGNLKFSVGACVMCHKAVDFIQ